MKLHDVTKIEIISALEKILARLRSKRKKIVFTNGCFDILHIGHIKYLKKARSLGDILVVGLNSDASTRAIKGDSRPMNNQGDRAEILSSLYFVDYVIIFDEKTPADLIRRLKPDVLVKGGDWHPSDIVGGDFVKARGGKVVALPFIKGHSTTALIKKLSKI